MKGWRVEPGKIGVNAIAVNGAAGTGGVVPQWELGKHVDRKGVAGKPVLGELVVIAAGVPFSVLCHRDLGQRVKLQGCRWAELEVG